MWSPSRSDHGHAGSSSSVDNDEVEVLEEEAEEAASSEGVGEHVVGLQLEGCAPIELRPVLKAAAREHLDKCVQQQSETTLLSALGGGGLDTRSVVWYNSKAQGLLHMARRQVASAAGRARREIRRVGSRRLSASACSASRVA